MEKIMPKKAVGKWSLGLVIVMPILFFIGSSMANTLYDSVSSGSTILEDIANRPALALTMLVGMACGISAFITGLIAIIKQKERSILVYISTIVGFGFILFLSAEFISPH
jgi:hypothetical protein